MLQILVQLHFAIDERNSSWKSPPTLRVGIWLRITLQRTFLDHSTTWVLLSPSRHICITIWYITFYNYRVQEALLYNTKWLKLMSRKLNSRSGWKERSTFSRHLSNRDNRLFSYSTFQTYNLFSPKKYSLSPLTDQQLPSTTRYLPHPTKTAWGIAVKVLIQISRAVLLGSFLALFVVFMIISQNVGGTISRSQEHDLILSHSFGSPSAPDQLPTWVLFLNTHLETTMNLVDLEISFALALAACKK